MAKKGAAVALTFDGFEKTLADIHKMGKHTQKILRKTIAAGSRQAVWFAKRHIKSRTRALMKSQGVKIVAYNKGKVLVAIIGARTAFVQGRNRPAWYSHLVHNGRGQFVQKAMKDKRGRFRKARTISAYGGNDYLVKAITLGKRIILAKMEEVARREMAKYIKPGG